MGGGKADRSRHFASDHRHSEGPGPSVSVVVFRWTNRPRGTNTPEALTETEKVIAVNSCSYVFVRVKLEYNADFLPFSTTCALERS